jgi:hypothetical protein
VFGESGASDGGEATIRVLANFYFFTSAALCGTTAAHWPNHRRGLINYKSRRSHSGAPNGLSEQYRKLEQPHRRLATAEYRELVMGDRDIEQGSLASG